MRAAVQQTCNDDASRTRLHLQPSKGKGSTMTYWFTTTFRYQCQQSTHLCQFIRGTLALPSVSSLRSTRRWNMQHWESVARVARRWLARSKMVGRWQANVGHATRRWRPKILLDAAHTLLWHTFHQTHTRWHKAWWIKSACVSRNANRVRAPQSFAVSCFVATSWVCLSVSLLFLFDWKPNRGSLATITAAEPGLA